MQPIAFYEYRDQFADLLAAFDAGAADQFAWSSRRADEITSEIAQLRTLADLESLLDSLTDSGDSDLLLAEHAATVAEFAGRRAWQLRRAANTRRVNGGRAPLYTAAAAPEPDPAILARALRAWSGRSPRMVG